MPLFLLHAPELVRVFMNASSATCRILSIVVLLLSLVPLGSVYMVLCSLTGKLVVEGVDLNQEVVAATGNNNSSAIMEHWAALLLRNAPLSSSFTTTANGISITFSFQDTSIIRDLAILLPWLISIFFGIIVPAIVSIVSLLYGGIRRQDIDDSSENRTRERRQARVLRKLKSFTKTLDSSDSCCYWNSEEDDTVQDNDIRITQKPRKATLSDFSAASLDSMVDTSEPVQYFALPCPGVSMDSDKISSRVVGEACAICLNPYQVGDVVTWSPNPDCIHCFHHQCITDWLIRKSSKQQACPCCRQSYIRPVAYSERRHEQNQQVR